MLLEIPFSQYVVQKRDGETQFFGGGDIKQKGFQRARAFELSGLKGDPQVPSLSETS